MKKYNYDDLCQEVQDLYCFVLDCETAELKSFDAWIDHNNKIKCCSRAQAFLSVAQYIKSHFRSLI